MPSKSIRVIAIEREQATAKNGKTYEKVLVTFRDLQFQKTETKTVMPFGTSKPVAEALSIAQTGEEYTIETVKNDAGYIDWIGVSKGATQGSTAPVVSGAVSGGSPARSGGGSTSGTAVTKSTYETPEERAKKQIYIVRQSSISSAIALLSTGAKSPPAVDTVIDAAKKFEDFVFGAGTAPAAPMEIPKPDFSDIDDDVPF